MLLPRAGLAAFLAIALPSLALAAPDEIAWQDLIPATEAPALPEDLSQGDGLAASGDQPKDPGLGGVVEHGMTPIPPVPPGTIDPKQLVSKYNGRQVKIAGYVLPLDYESTSVKEFLLVPYVGACIHVPPPPPNQIIYVTSEQGIEVSGMFEPVWVTGQFKTIAVANELADVGYGMALDEVMPYEQ